ncbi:MAG: serine hydrolase domain-containing protein [Acidobacteriota bacterium]
MKRLFLSIGLATSLALAQEDPSAKIDRIFEDVNKPESPGVSVAVIKDGRVVFSKGYGSANLEYAAPITPDTVFHVASVSKQFTAMALVLLEQEGKLALDDDLQKHLPDLPDYGKNVTVRQLLQHTSGIRDQWQTLAVAGWRLDDIITQNQILQMLYRQKQLNFDPGSEHLYSNGGYTLAAEVVRRVSGKTLRAFCEERIFKPLGMTHTHFHDDLRMIVKNRAVSYRPSRTGFENAPLNFENVGATSLFTTAEDLARWLDNFRDPKVGGRAAVERLQEQAVLADGKKISYALGVSVDEQRGLKRVSHGGGDAGFRSVVTWYPELNLGVALVSNLGSLNVGQKAERVAEVFAATQMKAEPASSTTAAKTVERVPVDPQRLAEHVGLYRAAQFGFIEVELKEGKLLASPPGAPRRELVPIAAEMFFVEAMNVEVKFGTEGDKKWMAIRPLQQAQPETRGERISKELGESPRDLAGFSGLYWSDELETQYRAVVEDGKLKLRHVRHGDIELRAIGGYFFSGSWFMSEVRFTRDAAGRITGLLAGGGRLRGIQFTRR